MGDACRETQTWQPRATSHRPATTSPSLPSSERPCFSYLPLFHSWPCVPVLTNDQEGAFPLPRAESPWRLLLYPICSVYLCRSRRALQSGVVRHSLLLSECRSLTLHGSLTHVALLLLLIILFSLWPLPRRPPSCWLSLSCCGPPVSLDPPTPARCDIHTRREAKTISLTNHFSTSTQAISDTSYTPYTTSPPLLYRHGPKNTTPRLYALRRPQTSQHGTLTTITKRRKHLAVGFVRFHLARAGLRR